VCRKKGLLNQIGRARTVLGLCTQLRAVGVLHRRYSTVSSGDASFGNSLEQVCEQGSRCTLCPPLTCLPLRALTTGYKKSLTGMWRCFREAVWETRGPAPLGYKRGEKL
jgi:hypothetical protein